MTHNSEVFEQVAISSRRILGEVPLVMNEIVNNCYYVGLFGALDNSRMKRIVDAILNFSSEGEQETLILDWSGVDFIDSSILPLLLKLNDTLRICGTQLILCGIKPAVAQSMLNAEFNTATLFTTKNLKRALEEALRRQGLQLTPTV